MIPSLLRQPMFRAFWLGQTISLFGDQISLIAVPLVAILLLHAGPAQMGLLVAAGLLPSLLFGSGLGGMLLDISLGAIFADEIPDRLRARVSGAYRMVNYGIRPLGA